MQTQTTTNDTSSLRAVFTAEVEDFPQWKRVFDSHAEKRREAGITVSHINHDAENPKLLVIYLAGPDAERVRAFVTNPELAARMRAAGVKGTPELDLYRSVESLARAEALPAAIVRHRVSDFDAWKALFDAHAATRAAAGVVGHAVNRKIDDPSVVLVYLQGSSMDSLKAFLSSPTLAEKMKAAGVGKPDVRFVYGEEPQH